jgi:type I restriction enzyme R subunit
MVTKEQETRFMEIMKRLKAAYDICTGDREAFSENEIDLVHFYLAIRSIIFKLTKGDAPDTARMNARVNEMIHDALQSEGVEEIFKVGGTGKETNLFDDDFLERIKRIKLPNAKIRLLEMLLAREIENFKRINRIKGVEFSKKLKAIVDKYNDRKEQDILVSEVLEEFTDEIIDLIHELGDEKESFKTMGIDIEEKSFYDILKALTIKYEFEYPDGKLIDLAKGVKDIVEDKAKYPAWDTREDIRAGLRADLIVLLYQNDYPPVAHDDAYREIFEQAENYRRNNNE